MRLALVQVDPTIGAMEANAALVLDGVARAKAAGADLALFSELVVTGYPPLDLLERAGFEARAAAAEAHIVREMPEGIVAVFGNVVRRPPGAHGRTLHNAAIAARRGEVLLRAPKVLLPAYDVFDEPRWFEPGAAPEANVLEVAGEKVGVTVCEDMWNDKDFWESRLYEADPVERLVRAGARVILNLSASPWSLGKEAFRRRMVGHTAKRHGVWAAYVNQVGGDDGLLFDGNSMVHDPRGEVVAAARAWVEDLVVVDTASPPAPIALPSREPAADLHDALVLGIRDYFAKLRFERAIVALSGGIDSAVTCALAVEALGPDAVSGLSLPSRYSSQGSIDDARALADNLCIRLDTIAIEPIFSAYLAGLAPVFAGRAPDVTEENLQSRIRGALVMACSNKTGAVVLTTGNKSECAVGYCTLYGDTCGGLAPIADLYKRQVYAVARWINRERVVIPSDSITKAPSAELRPNQKDQDSLPPYDLLDDILELLIEERASIEEIARRVAQPEAMVRDIARKVMSAEFKRKQFAPTLRVSKKAWIGRNFPLAHRFQE